MRTGVIVGRFQTDVLHEGYFHLFRRVMELSDRVIIIIGNSPTRLTDRYPLSVEMRAKMILESFPSFEIYGLDDHSSDSHWVRNLDEMLQQFENVTLYGSRDSFLKVYNGVYPTFELDCPNDTSSSQRRAEVFKYPPDNDQYFRAGMIYASMHKFPVVYSTVDIIVLNDDKTKIILGRKHGESLWRMPGGFVDPSDNSFEEAAIRELQEEMVGMQPKNIAYFGSFKIDDWRYRNCKDSIMTNVFECTSEIIPTAGDDLEEVKEFSFDEATIESFVLPEHKKILLQYEKKHNNRHRPVQIDPLATNAGWDDKTL